jgi:uncharacterized protein
VKINISDLKKEKGKLISIDLKKEIFIDEEHPSVKAHLMGDLSNTGRIIFFKGKVKGNIYLMCSRCLESFLFNFLNLLEEEFYEDLSFNHFEENLDSDTNFYFGNVINLKEVVRQNIILNIPIAPICNLNCKGICPSCGKNKNYNECSCNKEIGQNEEFSKLDKLLKSFLK